MLNIFTYPAKFLWSRTSSQPSNNDSQPMDIDTVAARPKLYPRAPRPTTGTTTTTTDATIKRESSSLATTATATKRDRSRLERTERTERTERDCSSNSNVPRDSTTSHLKRGRETERTSSNYASRLPKPRISGTPARPAKRPRPRSPKSPPPVENRSPLIRRIPSMLGEGEEFVDVTKPGRSTTPRSKRLRLSGDFHALRIGDTPHVNHHATREATAMSNVTNAEDIEAAVTTPMEGVKEEVGVKTEATSEEEDEMAEEYSILREAKDEADAEELRNEGFTEQEAQLFLRIRNRGLEPLMPAHWQVDFPTMPTGLFFPEKGIQVGHIDSVSLENSFQATNALAALVRMGVEVRGRIEGEKDPEERVVAALKKYIQWSVDDVTNSKHKEFSEIYPRIVLVRSNGKGAEYTETRVRRKLNALASEVRLEETRLSSAGVPRDSSASSTVYGIAVSGPVVALLTLDARTIKDHSTSDNSEDNAAKDDVSPRTMIILDFSDVTLDFWNAIAVALLVISAREDELARHEFYRVNGLRMGVDGMKKRGWEVKRRESALVQ
ncbi:hypothetical protein FPQ18DRAFT_399512, partial [Pyronema domesticum]